MHKDSKVARRFAKALIGFAIEQNELEAVANDMELISSTCSENKELVLLLKSPIIKIDKKLSILNEIFGGKIGSISLSFIGIIAKRNRENFIPEISEAFMNQYKGHKGISKAEVISAFPLDEESRKIITAFIKRFSDKVELTERVDKSLIGGFIVRVGDKQYDDSILNRINDLKKEFSKNPYISQL